MYGSWITASGKVLDVVSECGHYDVFDYSTGNSKGYIQTVIHSNDTYLCRIPPSTVTLKALYALLKQVKDHPAMEFMIDKAGSGTTLFRGERTGFNAYVQNLIKDKRNEQKNRAIQQAA